MHNKPLAISIIGSGNMAKGIGTRLVAGGHPVSIYSRNAEQAESLAAELKQESTRDTQVEARSQGTLLEGEIIILAVPYSVIPEIIKEYSDQLQGKILVDISNPVDFKTFELVTPADSSAAEEISKIVPEGTKVVKAFNTNFAGTLIAGEVDGKPLDVFMAGDDEESKKVIAHIIRTSGLRPLDVGLLKQARVLEGIQLIQMKLQDDLESNWMSAIKILSVK
ncbi:MAG TPA: NADPH-dependent F420 reductase [Patescibacteria group bacterium]